MPTHRPHLLPRLLVRLGCLLSVIPAGLFAQPSSGVTRPDTTLLASPVAPALRAGDTSAPAIIAAVRAADDERLAATMAGDRTHLNAIFSDDLHYAHSNGKVDTKASFVDALVSKKSIYESFDHQSRTFVPAGPGVVMQHGRVRTRVRNASGVNPLDLSYLAIWRLENGRWRFLAWQSCKNPAPAASAR